MEAPDNVFVALVGAAVIFGGIGAIWGMFQTPPSAIGGFIAGVLVAGVVATAVTVLWWIVKFLGG